MYNSICAKRGITIIEVLVALCVVIIGVLALISLQPSAWRLSGKSDFLGRAAGVLQRELQAQEAYIMSSSSNFGRDSAPLNVEKKTYASGPEGGQAGDAEFTVVMNTASAPDVGGGCWRVTVTVTWPGNPAGISETLIVSRGILP